MYYYVLNISIIGMYIPIIIILVMIQYHSCPGRRPDAGLPPDGCRASRCDPGKPQAAVVNGGQNLKGRAFGSVFPWVSHGSTMTHMETYGKFFGIQNDLYRFEYENGLILDDLWGYPHVKPSMICVSFWDAGSSWVLRPPRGRASGRLRLSYWSDLGSRQRRRESEDVQKFSCQQCIECNVFT